MPKPEYRTKPNLGEILARIVALGTEGKHDEAKATAERCEVENASKCSLGRTATKDTNYDSHSTPARAKYAGKSHTKVAAAAVSEMHEDNGPNVSDKHNLVVQLEKPIQYAIDRGLPAIVAAERCAAYVLDKNARRMSAQRRHVVMAVNELIVRLEELEGRPADPVPMYSDYESPIAIDILPGNDTVVSTTEELGLEPSSDDNGHHATSLDMRPESTGMSTVVEPNIVETEDETDDDFEDETDDDFEDETDDDFEDETDDDFEDETDDDTTVDEESAR